jgi:drug/metabolite transporter (DMT)-like permease
LGTEHSPIRRPPGHGPHHKPAPTIDYPPTAAPMLIPLLLGLSSGLCWGAADFVGGLQARRLPALAVAFWSQVAGAVALAVALALVGQSTSAPALAWGVVAGVFGGGGLLCFYRGLAIGPMSIVAPVAACGAAVPVLAAILLGQPPGWLALGGIAAALLGIVLVSTPSGPVEGSAGRPREALAVALGAAVCFGCFFVFLDRGVEAGGPPLWVVGAARLGSLATIGLLALAGRRPLPWPGRRAPVVAAVGLTDTLANVLFTFATSQGNLGVVSVLGSLYPVATVLLARLVLAERLGRPQGAGVAVALTGVALMATG